VAVSNFATNYLGEQALLVRRFRRRFDVKPNISRCLGPFRILDMLESGGSGKSALFLSILLLGGWSLRVWILTLALEMFFQFPIFVVDFRPISIGRPNWLSWPYRLLVLLSLFLLEHQG
jgi:hypothetical protein